MRRARRVDQCFPMGRSKKSSTKESGLVWFSADWFDTKSWLVAFFFGSFFSFPTQISPTPHPIHKRVFSWLPFRLFSLLCRPTLYHFFVSLVRSVLSLSNSSLISVRIIHNTCTLMPTYPHAHPSLVNCPEYPYSHITHTHTHIPSPCIYFVHTPSPAHLLPKVALQTAHNHT